MSHTGHHIGRLKTHTERSQESCDPSLLRRCFPSSYRTPEATMARYFHQHRCKPQRPNRERNEKRLHAPKNCTTQRSRTEGTNFLETLRVGDPIASVSMPVVWDELARTYHTRSGGCGGKRRHYPATRRYHAVEKKRQGEDGFLNR